MGHITWEAWSRYLWDSQNIRVIGVFVGCGWYIWHHTRLVQNVDHWYDPVSNMISVNAVDDDQIEIKLAINKEYEEDSTKFGLASKMTLTNNTFCQSLSC